MCQTLVGGSPTAALFYLHKRIVKDGDNKQCQPNNVFQNYSYINWHAEEAFEMLKSFNRHAFSLLIFFNIFPNLNECFKALKSKIEFFSQTRTGISSYFLLKRYTFFFPRGIQLFS